MVDPAELELALLNLAINSRDTMPDGGSFRVSARNARSELPPMFHTNAAVVEAADNGKGIAPEILHVNVRPRPFLSSIDRRGSL